jgi:hypothetical protein
MQAASVCGNHQTPRLVLVSASSSYAFVPPPAAGKTGILLFLDPAWHADYFIMHDRSLAVLGKV